MDAYRVDATEILHDLGASVHIAEEVPFPDLSAGETEFVADGPAWVDVLVTNTGAGLVASGTIEVSFRTECSRCLEQFTLVVTGTVEGFYTTPDKAEELSDDQEWEPLGDGVVDLSTALESAVRLELPFVPLHDEGCEGICPECGCNLNEVSCTCDRDTEAQGPFDSLKGLFDETES